MLLNSFFFECVLDKGMVGVGHKDEATVCTTDVHVIEDTAHVGVLGTIGFLED